LKMIPFNGGVPSACPPFTTAIPSSSYPILYPLSFHILAHSFALKEKSTPLFSSVSALFRKNTGGGVPPPFASRKVLASRPCATFGRSACVFSPYFSVYPLE
jgi:hypothetical protein